MSTEAQTLQPPDLVRLGWKIVELRHYAELLWTEADTWNDSDPEGSDDLQHLERLRDEILALLTLPNPTATGAISATQQRFRDFVAHEVAEYRNAWFGESRRAAIDRFPVSEDDDDGQSFRRHLRMLEDATFPHAPWDRIDAVGTEFEGLLPELQGAAFGIGRLLSVGSLPTYTISAPLRRPHDSSQVIAWKRSDIVPAVRRYLSVITRSLTVEVQFDFLRLEIDRNSRSWFDLHDDLMTALDPTDRPLYLGIATNPNDRSFRRDNFPVVTFTPLEWRIANILLAGRMRYVEQAELYAAWGVNDIEHAAFAQALKRVRRAVRPLGIIVQNNRQSAWRFVAAQGSAST